MEIRCTDCIFCDLILKEGDLFNFINPVGYEVSRTHDSNVYICRANPPIGGDWPQVTKNDWCGKFQPAEVIEEE